jgi:AcrR family transcriptional regulator
MAENSLDESQILRIAMGECRARGYRAVSIERVAAQAGASAADLLERWPTKSALLMDALRAEIGGDLIYPDTGDFAADLRTQLHAITRLFDDPEIGPFVARLLGEAQQGPAMVEEFRNRVYNPNRRAARQRFQTAQEAGQLRADIDIDAAIDLTFAPFWFRLLVQSGTLDEKYTEAIVAMSLRALAPDSHQPPDGHDQG